jgi:hypothetical protein
MPASLFSNGSRDITDGHTQRRRDPNGLLQMLDVFPGLISQVFLELAVELPLRPSFNA